MRPTNLKAHVEQIGLEVAEANLRFRGYTVSRPPLGDQAHLVVNDVLYVQVHAALWTKTRYGGGRYQFNTRPGDDVYVLVCADAAGHAFVIPGYLIRGRRNVAIWSRDPTDYLGKWSGYLDRWTTVEEALEQCQRQLASSSPEKA